MKKQKFKYIGDLAFKRFLQGHECPTSFHVVRMRFLGEIASPDFAASPMKTIESFWSEGLPEFEDEGQLEPFVQTFMGLWNRMSRHQKGVLVKLVKPRKLRDWDDLAAILQTRGEEIRDGFLVGFRGSREPAFMPEVVKEALSGLEEMASDFEDTANQINGPERGQDHISFEDHRLLVEERTRVIETLLTVIVKFSTKLRQASIEAMADLDDETPLH
jgi:hypothetical protein